MKYFIVYNPRSESITLTNDLASLVHETNSSCWDVVVSDITRAQRFLGLSDAAELLDFESPFDCDDGYMIAFSAVSLLSDHNIDHSVAFNEENGSWGLEVECYELAFVSVGLGATVVDTETGERVFTQEIQDICLNLDQTVDNIMAGA